MWGLQIVEMKWVDMANWASFSTSDVRLERLVGDKAKDFLISAVCVVDRNWTLQNQVRKEGKKVDLERLCHGIEVVVAGKGNYF